MAFQFTGLHATQKGKANQRNLQDNIVILKCMIICQIQGNSERGGQLFKQLCNGCHTSALRGIFGKPIASGNMAYTSGLEAKAMEKWTFKNLDAFLEAPKTFAPETAMGAVAVKNAKDRRDIIEYLKV